MTAVEVKEEIAKLREVHTSLTATRAQHDELLARQLAVEPRFYNEDGIRAIRARRARIEDQLTDAGCRIQALEAQLPSVDATRKAEAELKSLGKEFEAAEAQMTKAWTRYYAALNDVANRGREFVDARKTALALLDRMKLLKAEFGSTVPIPADQPRPPLEDAKVAAIIGLFVSRLGDGMPDAGLVSALDSARNGRVL